MKKREVVIRKTNEKLTLESCGYKDIIEASRIGGGCQMRTIWKSDREVTLTLDNQSFFVKRLFVCIDGCWFELDQQNQPSCGYCLLL